MANPQQDNLKVGTNVKILNTENVMHRWPNAVGATATIDKVPVHPSTWFSVKLHTTKQILKLQPTALKIMCTGSQNKPDSIVNNENGTIEMQQKQAPVIERTKPGPGRPRTNSVDSTDSKRKSSIAIAPQNSLDFSHAHTLTLGSEVVIRATETVLQRTPHLAGQIGYVKEVPVHPATWFKVRFPDGSVSTFRPSALRLSSQKEEEMSEISPYRPLPSGKPKHTAKLLTPAVSSDSDFKPGMVVRVSYGKNYGLTGKVLSASNGWVQLQTSSEFLAKRSSDLDVVEDASYLPLTESNTKNGRPNRPIKPNRFYGDIETSYNVITGRSARTDSFDHYETSVYKRNASNRSQSFDDYNIPDRWKNLNLPLVDENMIRAKRELVQKYVDRHADHMRRRPDLKYWLDRIRGVPVVETFEKQVTCDVVEERCQICLHEKWAGGKFCWNESCSSSPAFGMSHRRLDTVPAVATIATNNHMSNDTSMDISTQVESCNIHPSVDEHTATAPDDTQTYTTTTDILGVKRPRSDSIAMTDCEGRTPERSWSMENLLLRQHSIPLVVLPPPRC